MRSILFIGGLGYIGGALLVLIRLCRKARKGDDLLADAHPVAPCEHTEGPSSAPTVPQDQVSEVV